MFSQRRTTSLGVVAAVAALLISACSSSSSPAGAQASQSAGGTGSTGGSITVGVTVPPNSFDPDLSIWGGQFAMFMNPVYDTLFHQQPDGTFTGSLAQSWKFLTPTTFQITLRKGVLFADGTTPVDATAVKANLDRLASVKGPRTAELAPTLKSVTVVDANTVVLNLNAPNPPVVLVLSQVLGMMVNPKALSDPKALALAPQGAGPYTLDQAQTVAGDTYVYKRNTHYWDLKSYPFDAMTVKVYKDANAMLTAVESGGAQVGYGTPDTITAAKGAGLSVITEPVNVFSLALTDRAGTIAKPIGDVRVRQALNYAVDRDALMKTVHHGLGITTDQIFAQGTQGFDPSINNVYTYDPTKARALLTAAGYPAGFTFTAALAKSADNNYMQALAGYFAAVGVTMKLETVPPSSDTVETLSKYAATDYSKGWQDTYTDSLVTLFPPATVQNPQGSEDPQFDSLFKAGKDATTDKARTSTFQTLSKTGVFPILWT